MQKQQAFSTTTEVGLPGRYEESLWFKHKCKEKLSWTYTIPLIWRLVGLALMVEPQHLVMQNQFVMDIIPQGILLIGCTSEHLLF